MRFLADVNIAQSVITFLRELGHDVLDSKKAHLLSSDIIIIQLAKKEARIILTRDKDFIHLVQLPKYRIPTIVFRLLDQKPHNIIKHLQQLLADHEEEVLNKSLTIIEEDSTNSYPY